MKDEISQNILGYIKIALPDLLQNGGRIFLEKPFSGFFITFNDNSRSSLVESYQIKEFGYEGDERKVHLFCQDILGK